MRKKFCFPPNELSAKFGKNYGFSAKGKNVIKELNLFIYKAIGASVISSVSVHVLKKGIDYLWNKYMKKEVAGNEELSSSGPVDTQAPFYSYNPSEVTLNHKLDYKPMVGMFLPEGFDAILYGESGSMKSYFAIGTLIQIGLGEIPTIFPPEVRSSYEPPQNVMAILVDGENGQSVFHERLRGFGDKLDTFMTIIEAKRLGNDLDSLFSHIENETSMHPAKTKILLVVDNLKSVLREKSPNQVQEFFNRIKDLREELKKKDITLTTITIHHTDSEGKKMGGTYDLHCLTPIVFKLEPDGESYKFIVEKSRIRNNGGKTYFLKVVEDGYIHFIFDSEITEGGNGSETPPEESSGKPEWKGKLPLEKAMAMKAEYQPGVSGYGLKPMAEKYGLKNSEEVRRELKALEEYLSQQPEE